MKRIAWIGAFGLLLMGTVLCWFVLPGARFAAFLCLGLLGLLLLAALLEGWAKKSQGGRRARTLFYGLLAAGALSFVLVEGLIIWEGAQDNSQRLADVVIVLGAGVNGTTPSLALQTRINAAADYLTEHPETPAILSGGQGPGEDITEAQAMFTALTARGIAPARLLREENSTSTAENFAFSKELLAELGVEGETAVIAVVSNDFHLYRARLLARREGLDSFGIPAELPWFWLSANYYVREYFALIKSAVFD